MPPSNSQIAADIRESRTIELRITSIIQAQAHQNITEPIPFDQAPFTRLVLRDVANAVTRIRPFVAVDPGVVAEWLAGVEAGAGMEEPTDPADSVTDTTLLAAIQTNWVAASEGL